jgi:hypothetical protein
MTMSIFNGPSDAETEASRYWNHVYTLLVLHCGAKDDDGHHRGSFVHHFVGGHGSEYKFGGTLGSGGKCYRKLGRARVDCYEEDKTPDRSASIDAVNAALVALT